MTSRTLVAVVALSAGACAPQAPLPLLLTPQTRTGLGEGYGPGIVSASARAMRFQLAIPAYVIVVRVTEDGVEQVSPRAGQDRTQQPGLHLVNAATPRRRDVAGVNPLDLPSNTGSLSCVPILDPNLNAKPDPTCVERIGGATGSRPFAVTRDGQLKVNDIGYWLLIVSDVRTQSDELRHQLRWFEADESEAPDDDASLLTTVQQLPGVLVGGRTTNWAAYYVGFAEVRTH